MSLLAVCSAFVAFAWIKFPGNKGVQRSQEYVMAGLLTIMGVMIITIFLKLIWHSCRRESNEMSHGRRAVRYQCPSRNDESNDYGVGTDGIGATSCDAKAVGSHVPSEFLTSTLVPSASN
jgi:hypothetical protein